MDNYLTLKDAEATINDWQARAERAEAACAFLVSHLKCIRDFDENSPWDDPGACAADALRRVDDCGSGCVRREELEAAKAEVERLREALQFAANSYREMATDEALSQTLYEVANIAKQALGKESK